MEISSSMNQFNRPVFSRSGAQRFLIFAPLVLIASFTSFAHADLEQGKRLYKENCTPCHGDLGKGDGAGAKALPVRPADHTNAALMSKRPDTFLRDVITKGGAAMGLSPFMPSWQGLFKDNEIQDLVSYVRSLSAAPNKADGK
jgi:mono/diheme cytochrome c family protein